MKVDLKFVEPTLKIDSNVAVIGSSGKLLNTTHGSIIDKFEEVIRFNCAPTKEFEKYVGSKTTVRVVNNHAYNNEKLDEKEWSNQPRNFVKELENTHILYLAEDLTPFFNGKNAPHPTSSLHLFNYKWMDFLKRQHGSSYNFSVGFTVILLCVFSEIKPSCFGFDLDLNASRTHYFENRPEADGRHDVNNEKNLLTNLFIQGKIYLY